MNDKAKQTTVTRRLWEQITPVFGWIKQQGRSNPLPFLLVVILLLSLVWITWETYRRDNLGFDVKTYWDWLDLLIIPVVLAIGAWWLNKSERESEREIAEKNRREDRVIADERRNQATLEAYFDRMVELLLEHDLMDNESEREILSTIARTRTLAVLWSLDGKRKGHVIRFLSESGLIGPEQPISHLRGADLSEADLEEIDLSKIDLSGVDLSEANLIMANLSAATLARANLKRAGLYGTDLTMANLYLANLSRARLYAADLSRANLGQVNLSGASLNGADLVGADLSEANLNGACLDRANLERAKVTDEQLAQAKSLKDAIMPDGTKHD